MFHSCSNSRCVYRDLRSCLSCPLSFSSPSEANFLPNGKLRKTPPKKSDPPHAGELDLFGGAL